MLSTVAENSSGVNLHSGDIMQAQLPYDGANLPVSVTDTTTGAVFTQTYAIDIPSTIGGTTAYIGFTGGTGGLTATEQIEGWTYLPSNTITSPVSTESTQKKVTAPVAKQEQQRTMPTVKNDVLRR